MLLQKLSVHMYIVQPEKGRIIYCLANDFGFEKPHLIRWVYQSQYTMVVICVTQQGAFIFPYKAVNSVLVPLLYI